MTVVPVATTRPPWARVCSTSRAVVAGTWNHSGCGPSPASWEETPVCRVTGATATPRVTRRVTSASVNGRPAEAISALPGRRLKTDWYAESG